MSVKDNIDISGIATTAGAVALLDNIATSDAPVVRSCVAYDFSLGAELSANSLPVLTSCAGHSHQKSRGSCLGKGKLLSRFLQQDQAHIAMYKL